MNQRKEEQRISPYLIVRDATKAIDFYTRAFGATETLRLVATSGNDTKIGHAELSIGGASFMLADEHAELDCLGPQSRGGATSSVTLLVDDVDAFADRAVKAGAKLERPVADMFYGYRVARLRDPFGHAWHVERQIEAMSGEEMQRRFEAELAGA
jgi:PhnB protein